MRTILPLVLVVLSSIAGGAAPAAEQPYAFTLTFLEAQTKEAVLGRWSLSAAWTGYMGLALELDDDGYKYWFYSDVRLPEEPTYPLVGTWELVNGVVTLREPEHGHLYATQWMLVKSEDQMGLLAPDNLNVLMWHKEKPLNRMLRRVPTEHAAWPLLNLPEASK